MQLIKGCGMALVVAGSLMAAATVLHPSRETAETIIASEGRLVASHVLCTVSWLLVLLGLPGLHAAARATVQRLGLVGFLVAAPIPCTAFCRSCVSPSVVRRHVTW
jgi:uncharacterized membrane protein YdjX (TVP38/TMEM64 family)